ncbi:MAG: hypothetical protein ABMA02_01000 [Saprospiraceae bacterium]
MDIQDKIEAYIKNRMPPDERTAFEDAIGQDPALGATVEQARIEYEAVNRIVEHQLLGWMREWHPEVEPPNRPPLVRRYWPAAAAVLAVAVGAVWFFAGRDQPETPTIFGREAPTVRPTSDSSKAVPEGTIAVPKPSRPNLPAGSKRYVALAEGRFRGREPRSFLRGTPSSGQPHAPDPLAQAVEAWEQGNTDLAANLAAAVPASEERFADAQVLLGQIRFAQKQFGMAEHAFRTALGTGAIGTDEAEWNILLCMLAQYPAKKTEFDRLLNKITDDGDEHTYKAAGKLLRTEVEKGE